MINLLGNTLVEDSTKRPHGLVRFIILLKLTVHLLAYSRTGFPASLLLLGIYCLLVKLFKVVIDNKILMNCQSLLLRHKNGSIVKGNDTFLNCCIVNPKSTPGMEIWVKSIFSCCLSKSLDASF